MKNIKIESGCKKFEPIHVEFDIETEDEARELWHRLNLCMADIKRAYNDGENPSVAIPDTDRTGGLWHALDNTLAARGIK